MLTMNPDSKHTLVLLTYLLTSSLRNDPNFVEWDVKLYYTMPYLLTYIVMDGRGTHSLTACLVYLLIIVYYIN